MRIKKDLKQYTLADLKAIRDFTNDKILESKEVVGKGRNGDLVYGNEERGYWKSVKAEASREIEARIKETFKKE